MTSGSILFKIRHRLRGGLRTSYWREVVRKRILQTSPVTKTEDDRCEIHALTSANDWLDLMWALKSFYYFSERHYRLCIHDDGSLGNERIATLTAHFPNGRIISREEANAEVIPALESYPRCREFRQSNLLAPKIIDFAYYLSVDRMLLIDSDVLCFDEPTELLHRIENLDYQKNCVNRDIESAYTVEPALVLERMGVNLISRFNSGLGLIHKGSLRIDWLEEFLGLPGIIGHFWRIEQTLFALCSSRYGTELLPAEYDVSLAKDNLVTPCRHYVGAIRHLLYREGVAKLVSKGFLQQTMYRKSDQ